MTRNDRTRRGAREPLGKLVLTLGAALCIALAFGLTSAFASGTVPYTLPVTLPADTTSPPVDAPAPYTPAVLSLIAQLEAPPFTLAEIQNATTLLHDGQNNTCNAVGPVGGPVANDGSGNVLGTTLQGNATTLTSQTDATHIVVASATGLTTAGETIYVGAVGAAEAVTVASATGTTITLNAPGLTGTHAAGESVTNDPALSGAGATFPVIKVASIAGFTAGTKIWIDVTSSAEQATIASVGTAGATGTGITLKSGLAKIHASGRPVYVTTAPSITKLCWADAQGINPTGGPSGPGGGAPNGQTLTTSPNEILGDASTFDRHLMNVWGQTEATEGRELMMTGLFGPQTDLNRLPNWGRGHQTGGEDPYLSGELVASQINGIQARGFMSEMKHFLMYNGQNQNTNTDVQDQAAHELYFTPYEHGFVDGRAAATMCSYQIWRDTSTNPALQDPISSLPSGPSPYANAGENPETWPLNESHFSCEQPLSLSYVLRGLWGSAAMVGTDYPAQHSTSGIFQGMEQEMPTTNGFMAGGNGTNDPTGSTCAYTTAATSHTPGDWAPCTGATDPVSHVGGIPNHFEGSSGTGCPGPTSTTGAGGCTLNQAVQLGVVPLSVLNQALARVLYQQERFGLLGCDPYPTATCTNPGGIGTDRSGNALIPAGPAGGATPSANLGTENGDAAVAELTSEEGSVLFKNADRPAGSPELPIRSSDLTSNNIALIGAAAEYAIASPSREASQGFPDRIAVNPLTTLGALSGHADAFVNVPALSPTGFAVPASSLKTPSDTPGLARTAGAGSPTPDPGIDFEAVNGNQLTSPATTYTWQGCLFVPAGGDGYTFRLQNTPGSTVSFGLSLDAVGAGGSTTLSAAANAGDTNIKVGSITGFAPGQQITIDTGSAHETQTISTVGTAGATGTGITLTAALSSAHAQGAAVAIVGPTITTLAAASAAGATNIKVASVAGFGVGQTVKIDTGANEETAVVTTVGTAGATGTGLTLASALTNAHATGASVGLAGPDTAGSGTSTTSCLAAWSTLGAGSPLVRTLSTASTFYQGHYQGNVPVATTNAGYVDQGLQNRQFPSGVVGTAGASQQINPSTGEYYALQISDTTPATGNASIRFGWSRVNGDSTDAAAAATGKGMAIVFVNDQAVPDGSTPTSIVAGIGQNYVNLINAVAAANPNTVVILQSAYADTVDTWLPNVKALLETWNSGQEGAVATARLLLGQANPSGHTAMTWPKGPNDSIWGYNETKPLYPGDTTGTHPERLNGAAGGGTDETEGIYTGYRFFDQEGLAPEFPFGFGLSYTTFAFSKEAVSPTDDGGLDVSVRVKNTGPVAGDEVVQVYLGAPSDQPAGVQFAPRALSQFQRISLQPGETEAVKMHVAPRALDYWSEADQRWVRATGDRTVYVGDADAPDHLPQQLTVSIPSGSADTKCTNTSINGTSIDGNVDVPAGAWCDLAAVTIHGNLTLHSPGGVRIRNSEISGQVLSNGASGAGDLSSFGENVICNSSIGGKLQISNSTSGSPWNIGGVCGGNQIVGGLTFNSNDAPSSITGNTISGGDLKCNDNTGLTGSGNTVTGGTKRGQCAGF
jgi:hypothetical protein